MSPTAPSNRQLHVSRQPEVCHITQGGENYHMPVIPGTPHRLQGAEVCVYLMVLNVH